MLKRVRLPGWESSPFVMSQLPALDGRAADFPDPAGAPTIGLLWAKRRQTHFRLHVPIAER